MIVCLQLDLVDVVAQDGAYVVPGHHTGPAVPGVAVPDGVEGCDAHAPRHAFN